MAFASLRPKRLTLRRDEPAILDLSELGVPSDADVLGVYFTPITDMANGFLQPGLRAQRIVQGQPIPHHLELHPIAIFGGSDRTDVEVYCVWVPPQQKDLAPLAVAMISYEARHYEEVIVPSCIVFEQKLKSELTNYFAKHEVNAGAAKNLLRAASFGHQLHAILPALMATVGAPKMPKELTSALSEMKKRRDKISHGRIAVDRESAARAITASLFGYRYLSDFGQLLK